MSEIFDTTTLITIAIAVFILLRLRSVLGTRTGHERPPFEPFEIDRRTKKAKPAKSSDAKADDDNADNVITLPGKNSHQDQPQRVSSKSETRGEAEINEYAKAGTKLNRGLREILESDPSFTPLTFLEGAKMAYEMIVTSFADGDRKTLRNLLSRDVFDGFAAAISERESRNEKVQSSFVGIEQAKIKSAAVVDRDAQITIEFTSQIISATIDASGKVIDGDPEQVGEVRDIWTFARDIRSKDPNWKLVATESDS